MASLAPNAKGVYIRLVMRISSMMPRQSNNCDNAYKRALEDHGMYKVARLKKFGKGVEKWAVMGPPPAL